MLALRRMLLAIVALLLLAPAAHAQLFRAYLASDGSDANPCTLPQPCRLLPAALTAVADGGEIWMLDSANYNTAAVTVAKSVSILAVPGAVGSVVATGGAAIFISAAGLNVSLRNIVIVPLPGTGATSGIAMIGASTLTVADSLIANLPSSGITILAAATVSVVDSLIRGCGFVAVNLRSGAKATISRTQMIGNGSGGVSVDVNSPSMTSANVSDSLISGGANGVAAFSSVVGADARIFVTRSTITGAGNGIQSSTTGVGLAQVTVSNSQVTNNTNGWLQSGAGSVINSLGNNDFTGNSGTGSLTVVPLQ